MVSDLSGQVSANLFNPIITAATVAIPQDVVGLVRTKTRDLLPTKWKHGALAGLATAVDLVVRYQLRYCVSQLHVADEAGWRRYFDDGGVFHREAVQRMGKPMHFLQPDLVLRMELLMRPGVQIVGRLLRARYRDDTEAYTVDMEVVADTDLRTQDTEEHFRLAMLEWPSTTLTRARLGLQPTVRDARCETEQAEPLLLFPDYIAGVYQHADPRTQLGKPVVSREAAAAAVADLRQRAAHLLFEDPFDFADVYPLAHDDQGRVIQTRDVSSSG
jgi:hypothetical protein